MHLLEHFDLPTLCSARWPGRSALSQKICSQLWQYLPLWAPLSLKALSLANLFYKLIKISIFRRKAAPKRVRPSVCLSITTGNAPTICRLFWMRLETCHLSFFHSTYKRKYFRSRYVKYKYTLLIKYWDWSTMFLFVWSLFFRNIFSFSSHLKRVPWVKKKSINRYIVAKAMNHFSLGSHATMNYLLSKKYLWISLCSHTYLRYFLLLAYIKVARLFVSVSRTSPVFSFFAWKTKMLILKSLSNEQHKGKNKWRWFSDHIYFFCNLCVL